MDAPNFFPNSFSETVHPTANWEKIDRTLLSVEGKESFLMLISWRKFGQDLGNIRILFDEYFNFQLEEHV
jgi:hypothetical protein